MGAYYEGRYEELKRMIDDESRAKNAEHQMTWQFGKNPYFEGMSKEEILLRVNGLKLRANISKDDGSMHMKNSAFGGSKSFPFNFDARSRWPECKYIGFVKDQSNCGSCWAVSSASVMSDRACIASGGKVVPFLSEEDIMSCCSTCGDGCNGGYPVEAFKYWVSNGVPTGGIYGSKSGCKPYSIPPCKSCPYTADTPSCSKKCVADYRRPLEKDKYYGKQYFCLSTVEAIQNQLIKYGPIMVGMLVYDDLLYYKSGKHVELLAMAKLIRS
uniref:Pept_C1 domain-containing protein n=1 Tax=Trichuris muris TaxID=70415 RepID=A0A5S6Q4R2_TRIMR